MSTQSLWEARYVVIDVETTGHDPQQHRIIELACLVFEAGRLTERFVSLVNAHQPVPRSITALTGITNGMLSSAPEEAVVFAHLAQLLSPPDTILVGHNIAFDRRFLHATLERLGYGGCESLPYLCTQRLARRLLPPTQRRTGLDALIAYFGLTVSGRHRAEPDAEATAAIFQHFLELAACRGICRPADLLRFQYAPRTQDAARTRRLRQQLEQLPLRPGVYRFYDRQGQLLYIGKAQELRQRVRTHLDADGLCTHHPVWTIRWEETPTELSALLRELESIWREQPLLNVASKELDTYSFVRVTWSETFPRLLVTQHLPEGDDVWLGPFPNRRLAEQLAELLQRWYRLRPCNAELRKAPFEPSCIYANLGSCTAPCNGSVSAAAYRQQVEQLLRDATHHLWRWQRAVSRALEHSVQAWEFERAAALRPLWRLLQRWEQSHLPLIPRECTFLLGLPLPSGGAEIFCVQAGVLGGVFYTTQPRYGAALRECLRGWENVPQLSWLDVARLDLLCRWLARSCSAALLHRFPTVSEEAALEHHLSVFLDRLNRAGVFRA